MAVESGPVRSQHLSRRFQEALDAKREPEITVGIVLLEDRDIGIEMEVEPVDYRVNGKPIATPQDGRWRLQGNGGRLALMDSSGVVLGLGETVEVAPVADASQPWATFKNLRTGRGFHWETRIDQSLPGRFEIHAQRGCLEVINIVPLERYLLGVVTGEMGVDCPLELLKAQAIAARSWALATPGSNHGGRPMLRCNDDHCQRYQGAAVLPPEACHAVEETRGIVLKNEKDAILDANYSKSCGGVIEDPERVWVTPKLGQVSLFDGPGDSPARRFFPVTAENLREYIMGDWLKDCDCYCSPNVVPQQDMARYLGRVDVSGSYFRWTLTYEQRELAELLQKNDPQKFAGIEAVLAFHVRERGRSGRIVDLAIEVQHGKERVRRERIQDQHVIRDLLHPSFLYSSAFVVDPEPAGAEVPERFVLQGAGWGHGAGMCQIGALGMALQGHNHEAILRHYFPQTRLERLF